MTFTSAQKIGIAVVALGIAGAIGLPVVNYIQDTNRQYVGSLPDQSLASSLLQQKCANCHAPSLSHRPIYATLPVASTLIGRHVDAAAKAWEMSEEQLAGAAPWSETQIARLEEALRLGNMPPANYTAMHWVASLSDADTRVLREFIADQRAQTPEGRLVAETHRGAPIAPIVLPADVHSGKATLGRKLYHDVRLSGDERSSCASCHDLARGGTDQAPVSTGIRGQKGPINAPTTYNAAYAVLQFWDGRAADLQEQAGGPVENPIEMGAKFDDVVNQLKQDGRMRAAFSRVFGDPKIDKERITDAIAEFERSLVTPDAPFDAYLQGDEAAISDDAKAGYELFVATGCVRCHFGPAVGQRSFEVMGRELDYFGDRGNLTDVDKGRYNVTKNDADMHAFKVPTLRNLPATMPYFHDGSASTMEEAVRQMAKYQHGVEMSDADVAQIVEFLWSLVGEYEGRPVVSR